MRTSWWACICAGVLTCSLAYLHFNRPPAPESVAAPEPSEQHPLEQKPELPLAEKDQGRLLDVDLAPAALAADQLPHAQEEARLEDAPGSSTIARSELNDTKQMTDKDEAPSRDADSAPAGLAPGLPNAQREARLEDATGSIPVEPAESTDAKQNLSYLAYYAYSELPPETKPADTVLNALKGVRPGTPVEEIKQVARVLGLDFTFMRTVAKVESNFDPTQRTGSYIGLFQLSKNEFEKYGSGDILAPRDNTVAAALKLMTEAILFEMFTHRTPTLNDLYLIHQQGIDGAAEHVSHPRRLAWRSMCATDEGKEKGEKWCKRAIWGNTLPAVKRIWKNVKNVTSGAFVAMWQQRVSLFYARYSEAAAN